MRKLELDDEKSIVEKVRVWINFGFNYISDLSNIFESFLPQLLTYPNPIDPLNGDAAAMYLHKPEEYKKKVAGIHKRYDCL